MVAQNVTSLVFSFGSALVMPFWLLMLLAPRWRGTLRIIESPFIVAGPMLLYAALVVPHLAALLPAVARPQLPAIASLLGTPRGATIAWLHFLALDLFAGRWLFLDARARGLSTWLVSPLLIATLLFAPVGLALYFAVRMAGADAVRAPLRDLARAVWSAHRPLAWLTAGSLALLAVSLVLQQVDLRQVMGVSAWVKPAKFAASIALAAPVLAWILGQLAGAARQRRLRVAGSVIAIVAALELVLITVQAARGVPSHFNNATRLDAGLFAVMGAAISFLWLAELYLTVRAFRYAFVTPPRTPLRIWGIRLGLLGTLAGGAIGFVMPRPTPAQLRTLRDGQATPMLGAHAVGVADGGPGLPVTSWSTEGGDLRAPHFFGLHALQVLPLAAVVLERRARRRRGLAAASARPVIGLGVAWIGLTLVTLAQALRGQPLLAPDGITLVSALAVLLVAGVLGFARGRASSFAPGPRQATQP